MASRSERSASASRCPTARSRRSPRGCPAVAAVIAALEGFSVRGGRIRLGGAGAFPSARRGRVLWVGVAEGRDVLARLAKGVAERLAPLGHAPEERQFRPHITIVRCAIPT